MHPLCVKNTILLRYIHGSLSSTFSELLQNGHIPNSSWQRIHRRLSLLQDLPAHRAGVLASLICSPCASIVFWDVRVAHSHENQAMAADVPLFSIRFDRTIWRHAGISCSDLHEVDTAALAKGPNGLLTQQVNWRVASPGPIIYPRGERRVGHRRAAGSCGRFEPAGPESAHPVDSPRSELA